VWTSPLPDCSLDIDLGCGRARMTARKVKVQDYFSIPNAFFHIQDPVSTDAACSFDIRWHGPVTSRGDVTTPGSSGRLLESQATMTWSAANASGFRFRSDPSPTMSVFAQLGRVRNGIFA